MRDLSRRGFLASLLAGTAAAMAGLRRAEAIGPGSKFRIGELSLAGSLASPHPSALERLGWELELRTSVDVGKDNPAPVSLSSEKLFEFPFLYLAGDRRFLPPAPHELEILRRYLTFGGFLLIDSAEGRAGGEFDNSVRTLVGELFPAPAQLAPLPTDHVIFKSFYLLSSVFGRVAVAPQLEALIHDGRAAIVYCQNDLGGAWAKDNFGNFLYQCYPSGEEQREHSFRLGINLVMYALCLDYKTDQVHVPFILKRRQWRVESDDAMTGLSLLGANARLLLAVVAGAAALAAVILRWRDKPRAMLASAMLCLLALVVLAGERAIALAVNGSAESAANVAYNEWRWVVSAPWGRFGLAAGAVATLATVYFSWRGTAREPLMWRRVVLVTLRTGACATALVLFLEPALELRHVTREPNHVAILIDDSRSMSLGEQKGGPTRAERAAALIRASAPTFEAWRQEHQIDFFTFSDTVMPSSAAQLETAAPARGDATAVREALELIRSRYDVRDLAGVIIVSDGAATGRFADGVDDGASQDFLAGLGVKVHTAWVGRPGLKDLSVARVLADDFAFVRTAVKIEAVIRATGIAAVDIPVTLRRDGVVVAQASVHVGGSIAEAHAVFSIVPDLIGKYVYDVSVPVLPEEVVAENNRRAFVMRVTRDKTRVLQVSGQPSSDERALRAFFKSDPNVDLISFFILRTNDDINMVPNDEMSLIPFPTEELFEQQLGSFDVIVLQNFEPGPYRINPYLDNIRQYVENGGALAMIGGDLSFSSGGYYGTPVAQALPVELYPPTSGDHSPSLLSSDEFHPKITDEGATHPVMQLRFDRHDNLTRWASLPPLEGVNYIAAAKAGASVLAEHPTLKGKNGQPMPVIVAGEYGKGRTLAVATDSDWRWGFLAAAHDGDDGRAYQKFWENSVRWLSRDPDLEYLHVDTDQSAYAPGVAPRLRARLVDKDYRPASSGTVELTVVPAEGGAAAPGTAPAAAITRKVEIADGEAQVEIPALTPGAYRLTGKTTVGERAITANDVFLVNPQREELERPAAREDVLSGIAKATGGEYLGDAGRLPASLPLTPPRVVRVDQRSDVELWSRPHLLFLAIALLGAEWGFRRRRGFL